MTWDPWGFCPRTPEQLDSLSEFLPLMKGSARALVGAARLVGPSWRLRLRARH